MSPAHLRKSMQESALLKHAMYSHSPNRVPLPSSPQLLPQSQSQSEPDVTPISDSAPSTPPHAPPHVPSLSLFCDGLATATASPVSSTGIHVHNAVCIMSPLAHVRIPGFFGALGLLSTSSGSAATFTDDEGSSVRFLTGADVRVDKSAGDSDNVIKVNPAGVPMLSSTSLETNATQDPDVGIGESSDTANEASTSDSSPRFAYNPVMEHLANDANHDEDDKNCMDIRMDTGDIASASNNKHNTEKTAVKEPETRVVKTATNKKRGKRMAAKCNSDSKADSSANRDAATQHARTRDHRRTSGSSRRGHGQRRDAGDGRPVHKLSAPAFSTLPGALGTRSRYPDPSSPGHGHGCKDRMALYDYNSSPRSNKTTLGPTLDNRGTLKMVSFAIPDENDPHSPNPIRRVPTARRIRRDVTPFLPRFRKLVSEDDDNDENDENNDSSSSNTAAEVEHEPGAGVGDEAENEETIMQRRQELIERIRKHSAEKARLLNAQMAADEAAAAADAAAASDEKAKKKVVHTDR